MDTISVKNLTKSFSGKLVLDNLSMEFPGGRTTCVMAPSGAGKTTLLRILMGLEHADSGTVEGVAGKRLSAVFQEERLCEGMTAIGNIRLVSPHLAPQAVLSALGEVGLSDAANQPVSELSGGMRRRVSILRALLAEYDVLFLDEPFQGLDNVLKAQVMAYVKEKTQGKTVLFVTHDSSEAEVMGTETVRWG